MTTPSRAHLAAALLGHGGKDADEGETTLRVGSSAVLGPWRHLLLEGELDVLARADGDGGAGQGQGQGSTTDREAVVGSSSPSSVGRLPSRDRRAAAGWVNGVGGALLGSRADLDLDPDEEERLADEWGLSDVLSNAGSEEALAVLRRDYLGANVPRATRSEVGVLVGRRARDEEGDGDVEVLETKSMPDLDRPRTVSFADAVLESLEQRLSGAPMLPPRPRSTISGGDDDAGTTGTRVKILERTATQRMRARTRSLGPLARATGLSGDGSVGEVPSGRSGIASRDSLFQRPSSVYTTRTASVGALDAAALARPSMDGLSLAPSRLSLAFPSGPAVGAADDAPLPARPATSLSLVAPSIAPSAYTSRFDPLVIAAHRAELAKDRPKFANPDGGKPPRVVLMPAPLAGRVASPPRRMRREGPDLEENEEAREAAEKEDGDGEGEGREDEVVPEGLREPLHPAGALYGRSLMDVIAERKAILKAQQRAYVPGSDGRKSMFEMGAAALDRQTPAAQHDEGDEENVPLALVPGGGGAGGARQARAPAARVKSTLSIFGPDLVYQRELAQMRELEETERAEREAREREEEAKRVRKEARRRKGKLRKGGRRKRRNEDALQDGALRPQEAVEWQPEAAVAAEEPVELAAFPADDIAQDLPPDAQPTPRETMAPSISVPLGVSQGEITSDWFEEVLAAPQAAKGGGGASSDDGEEDLYKPRPVSSLGSYHRPGSAAAFDTRRNTFLSSDSSSSSDAGSDVLDDLASPVDDSVSPGETGDQRLLPLPGEPSSNGHDSASLAETEDDVPLGIRYSRQSLALPAIKPTGLEDLARLVPQPQSQDEASEAQDEDDAPLGARFSRVMPAQDDGDDFPLALRRVALAPSAAFTAPPMPQPFASIRPVGDDGKTVVSDDSDDLPLGLKAAPTTHPFAQHPSAPYPFPHAMPHPAAHAAGFPYSASQAFLPPFVPTFAPAVVPPLAPNPPAHLALAQIQMEAAMQQQAALAGGGDSIERWRRDIAG